MENLAPFVSYAHRQEAGFPRNKMKTYADSIPAAHAIADHFRATGEKSASAYSTTYTLKDLGGRTWIMTEWQGKNWPEFETLDMDRAPLKKTASEAYAEFFQI